MVRSLVRIATIVLFLAPAIARAQGLLIVENPNQQVRLPRPIIIWPHPFPHPVAPPPVSYKIKELDVQARLIDQVAQVQVSQTYVNTGSLPLEAAFVFPLPYDGAITQMTLMIDGKEYPARLLDAQEARRMYEEIVRRNRDPALLEWLGTGLFRTNVFPVPAGASRTVTLRYAQLCRKQEGMTDFLFPLSTAKYTSQPVEKVEIRATIESQEPIKNIYSPTHAVEIKRSDERHATIATSGKNEVPTSDFRLFYDVGRGKVSTRVLSYRPEQGQDGFFLLLASPEIKAADQTRPAKTVVLVIDRSGSMSGTKIEQVRSALKYVLNNLRPGDLFNIIAYDDQVESFKPELQRFDEETRKAALGFVEGIYAGGTTNIDGAMHAALSQLQGQPEERGQAPFAGTARRVLRTNGACPLFSGPSYVIFLTDGLPTAGETNEMKIVANAKELNKLHARVFAFGVGYDVNSRLLDKLVRENFGLSEYVRPNEDIEGCVSKLYSRIESPVMTGVQLKFVFDAMNTEEGPPINRVYPKDSFDLFAGEQLAVVGRYRKPGTAKVIVEGMVGGNKQSLDFPATLVDKSHDESFAFIEKLWAIRRVGEILDQLDLRGKNDELVKELVDLATRHGILTPYTSFMTDERTNIHDLARNAARATGRLDALAATSGEAAFGQRAMKGGMQNAQQADSFSFMPAATKAASGIAAKPTSGFGGLRPELQAEGEMAGRELSEAGSNMQQIGNRNFFHRNGQWVDSQVTANQAASARRVKQFSDEYFKLAEAHGRTFSKYMVFDEPVVLNLDGQTYLIESGEEGENSPSVARDNLLVLDGIVTSVELSPTVPMTTQNYIITMRVDQVVKGRFEGKTFQFRIHSPAMSGLDVGQKRTVECGAPRKDTQSINISG